MASRTLRQQLMASALLGGAFAASMLAGVASAQTTAPTQPADEASAVEQIVVTGYRSSLSKALGAKR